MSGINPRKVTPKKATISAISNLVEIIDSFGNTTIILPNGIFLHLEDALSNSRLKKNLFSFKMYIIMDKILRN